MENIAISIYVDESPFSYISYKPYYIFEDSYLDNFYEIIKGFIVQIPLNQKINKLSIDLEIKGKNYHTDITTKNDIDNYFYLQNIYNEIIIDDNRIFTYFLNFFINNEKKEEKNLIESLIKGCLKRITEKEIVLSAQNIIHFFKFCIK